MEEPPDFARDCAEAIERIWRKVERDWADPPPHYVPDAMREPIRRVVNSKTVTYRYTLITQPLAKVVNSHLDCRSVQAQYSRQFGVERDRAFDARSIAHEVVVPFKNRHHLGSVLRGSEPYLSKPMRLAGIRPELRVHQKDKQAWDLLCVILDDLEANSDHAEPVLRQTLVELRLLRDAATIQYPVPERTSLQFTRQCLQRFLAEPSGGHAPLAVAFAILSLIANRFGVFHEVRRAATTAPDATTGMVADIECLDDQGAVVLAAEVKDRVLTLAALLDKLQLIEERCPELREMWFAPQQGIEARDEAGLATETLEQFRRGRNIYVLDISTFVEGLLLLVGERGRIELLELIGQVLDEYDAPFEVRRRWAEILAAAQGGRR